MNSTEAAATPSAAIADDEAGDSRASGKRKKAYYRATPLDSAPQQKRSRRELGPGMCGFIVSYPRGRDRAAQHDCLSLLNEFADRLYGTEAVANHSTADDDDRTASGRGKCGREKEDGDEEDEEEDIATALERESRALRQAASRCERFAPVDSGVNQLLFISTTVDNPVHLLDVLLEGVSSKKANWQASRNVLRLLPVQVTCRAEVVKIEAAVEQVASSAFQSRSDGAFTYSIMFKCRNNSASDMHRDVIIPKVADVIHRCYPSSKVDLSNPDFFVFVEILKTVCCVSVVTRYFHYKKFNIQELCAATSAAVSSVKTAEEPDCKETSKCGDCDGSGGTSGSVMPNQAELLAGVHSDAASQ